MPSFRLPTSIHPASNTAICARSLYTAEDGDMNKLEQKLIVELTALPNVRWWHRNIARQGFAICDPFLQEQRTEGIQVLQAERRTERCCYDLQQESA